MGKSKGEYKQKPLFKTKIVPGKPGSGKLFEEEYVANKGPVECLGMTFENDEKRREYFLEKLREKLKDPEFRKIEGFPIGEDEDILALSDPPYYTACPNPFIEDFIKLYGKPYEPETDDYRREPFAADVSEGKNDPIYNAHSYHTKVPHKAIMRYILHYTEPGDVVFDGFCGTGMTGVAAQLCRDKSTVESLGYTVGKDGTVSRKETDEKGKTIRKRFSRLGARRAVLNDLSPAATFIAYNYNTPVDEAAFQKEAEQILEEVEKECGWMYETLHVEPASSRLISSLGFIPCDPFQATQPVYRKDNLPHIQIPGATYFITFRTANRRILSDPAKKIILDSICYWDDQRWKLFSAVVMPDHAHLIARPLKKDSATYWDISDILHSIKSFSANEINKIEGKTGVSVWQTESYDRVVRDSNELGAQLAYINHNPVKAGLVEPPKNAFTSRRSPYMYLYNAPELEKAGWKPAPLGKINYTVWSDIFVCPECAGEIVFWEAAVDKAAGKVNKEFPCTHCNAILNKRNMDRAFETKFDKAINKKIRKPKQVPVLISYKVGRKRFQKKPDEFDLQLISKIDEMEIPYWFPVEKMMFKGEKWGDTWRAGVHAGITHAHHFFSKRNLWTIAKFNERLDRRTRLAFQSIVATLCSRLVRYNMGHRGNGPLSGTLYVSSLIAETRPTWVFPGKVKAFSNAFISPSHSYTDTQSTSNIPTIEKCNIDYVFTDPPFGGNLMYSELNFLWEAWLKVLTNNKPEAIENRVQNKGLPEYQKLMTECFGEYYRVLKPGRWMTVEFHNSKNSVWNAIQEALQHAGFVIADVRTLDKQQGTFKQVSSGGAVKQDLIISAYKPNGGLEDRFKLTAGTEDGVWGFVRTHLKQLPVFVSKNGQAEVIAERQNYLLFDRMVAFHVQRGVTVPMSAAEFYVGLEHRFPPRDGMYFLPDQAAEYDKKRMTVKEVLQLQLFVSDEASAIQWLKQLLAKKPQTFQDIHPQFLKEIGGWQKHEKTLELSELLKENFLLYDGKGEVPSQIHSYLSSNFKELRNLEKDGPALKAKAKDRWYVPDPNKAGDLEKLRERSLLREFEEYRSSKQKRLKVFRLEAVRAGFKKAWQERDYATIIAVARKIPEKILQEDPKLLMWYDQAVTRVGDDT